MDEYYLYCCCCCFIVFRKLTTIRLVYDLLIIRLLLLLTILKWYLPSQDELLMFYVGQPVITYPLTTNKYYYGSTEFYGSAATATALWNQIPSYYRTSSNYAKAQLLYVRCVRQIPNGALSNPYVETNSRIINNTGFATAFQRSTPGVCPHNAS